MTIFSIKWWHRKKLVDPLPKPVILLGEFNNPNTLWRCKDTNKKGKILEKVINENDMCLLNNGTLTYVNLSRKNHSAIDLTICNPSVYIDFTWTVHDDTCGSDHFPIMIKSIEPCSEKILRWKLDKANWETFKEKCKNKLAKYREKPQHSRALHRNANWNSKRLRS